MNMLDVKEINELYKLRAEEENYENQHTVDVVVVSDELIELSGVNELEPKTLTDQESIRRFLYGKRELERLLRDFD